MQGEEIKMVNKCIALDARLKYDMSKKVKKQKQCKLLQTN